MSNKLLEYAKSKIGFGYVFGSQGEVITAQRLEELKNTFGIAHYIFNDAQGPVDAKKWIGQESYDCSGLVVSGLLKLGLIKLDYTADGLYHLCKNVAKSELREGDLTFVKDSSGNIVHVGIYFGNGQVIEAKGTRYGVVCNVMSTRFNLFGRLPFDLDVKPTPTPVSKYSKDEPIIVYNGKILNESMNVKPTVKDGHTISELKVIVEALGHKVKWVKEENRVVIE